MKRLILGCFVMVMIFSSVARAEGLKEGKWRIRVASKMEGMPDMSAMMNGMNIPEGAREKMAQAGIQMNMGAQAPTISMTHCITNQNPIPKMEEHPNSKCDQPEIKKSGDTVNYHITCTEKDGKMEITGHSTYTGDTMTGESQMHGMMGGKEMNMTTQMTGKYVGPC